MRSFAISGGWMKINEKVEADVRNAVSEIISRGDGIVSGGALGVDYIATDQALRMDCARTQLKILIPSKFETYREHYFNQYRSGVVTGRQTSDLISQLEKVKNRGCLLEGDASVLNKESYFNKIIEIVESADELVAFHINKTEGTQYTIDKAKEKGIPIKIFEYEIN